MPNRLANETSPYLLQHAGNPVDWQPWGEEALAAAKDQDKPIFLSIGYSACHWCHVMAHESFENPQIAAQLNRDFISIKVDREERPELDQIYMEAVQMLTQHGGWPLSAFLTPDLEPFFGGTYWPPEQRGGMPGFNQVLAAVADAWQNRRDEIAEQARKITGVLKHAIESDLSGGPERLGAHLLEGAYAALSRAFDRQNGGFGGAPKFPHPMDLRLMLRRWRRTGNSPVLELVNLTLDKMAAGGIYDHLGGGFHRYSTDAQWLVPHFEKMLYDNALIPACYLEAYQVTGRADYARVVRETLDYVLRDLADPAGGFYSSEDADSEGQEGKFYLWTLQEVRGALGPEKSAQFECVYDVTDDGNFEGRNILNRVRTIEACAAISQQSVEQLQATLAECRCKLFGQRSKRVPPGKDDKVLVNWNGLMIDTLAQAGGVLDEPRYIEAAARAADFLLKNLRDQNGRLLHAWRAGKASVPAFLDDHASLGNALVSLYEVTFDERWIDEAVGLADEILARFTDRKSGGFYTAAEDHPSLVVRLKDMTDSSLPSGGGLAVMLLLRLGKLCGRDDYRQAAEMGLRSAASLMEQHPIGMGQMLLALDAYLGPTPEVVVLGAKDKEATDKLLGELHRRYLPNKVLAFRESSQGNGSRSAALAPLFENKQELPPGPTLYVCENYSCLAPVSGEEAVLAQLDSLAEARG